MQELKICETILIKSIEVEGHNAVQLPTMGPRRTYKPLSSAKSWYEYFKDLNGTDSIEFVKPDFTPRDSNPNSVAVCNMLKLASDSVSTVLTALAALELTIPDLSQRDRLTIHVLGGTARELMILRLNEEFLHLLPNLRLVTVGYIGPDTLSETGKGQLLPSECCQYCKAAGRKRQVFLRKRLYHECDEASLFPEFPPDLIMACNSGHADEETESWRPTLERILAKDIPAVFTTFTEQEAIDEQTVFGRMGAHFVQTCEKNRWHGLVPKIENFGARYEVFYYNHYTYIVKGKK
ncbi:MAG: hypothetical protein Q9195_008513 [Heterodermia aff. obscurata]